MIEYKHAGQMYALSYPELKKHYEHFVSMSDAHFIKHLPEAAHLACFISWIKEEGQAAVSDTGIVHELLHHISGIDGGCSLQELRDKFKNDLKLF